MNIICEKISGKMGLKKLLLSFLVLGAVSAGVLFYLCPELRADREPPKLEDEWWGRGPLPKEGKLPKDNTDIKKYVVKVDDIVLKDLQSRLNNTRFVDALENVQFQYGFHSSVLREVVAYWKTKYDWRKQEKEINKFSHFTTQIEGIDVHFIHQKPNLQGKKLRVLPLLLVHGWPGSVYEFYKIIPLLTTPREDRDYVFEVICPSVPGFGFSEAPHQPGFSQGSAARVFTKLMDRLGHKNFYAKGGDFISSFTATTIAIVYPERVLGLHSNSPNNKLGLIMVIKYAVGNLFPSLFFTPEEKSRIYPFRSWFGFLLEELGYVHIQATKPETVGTALADSPAGLAAYILEKFSTWTHRSYRDLSDGGLTKRFTMDELLTNVMIYWCTNSITSSQRIYKELFNEKTLLHDFHSLPVKVPVGIAQFPNDLIVCPKSFFEPRFRNVVQHTLMPRGGHFSALEEPKLLADDIWNFVIHAENSKKQTL